MSRRPQRGQGKRSWKSEHGVPFLRERANEGSRLRAQQGRSVCSGLCGGNCYGASDLGVNPLKGGPAMAGGHGPHSRRLGVTQGLQTYPGQPARSEAIPEGTQSQRQRWDPEGLAGLDSQAQKSCPPLSLPASARREHHNAPGTSPGVTRELRTRGHA